MKLKKVLLLGLSLSMLWGCSVTSESGISEDESTKAWNILVDAISTLNSHDEIIIYNYIGTLDSAHDEYSSKDGKTMDYYKAGYNYFLQKTIIENQLNQVTYLSDYGSVGECTSVGNKFNYIIHKKTDDSIFPKQEVTEHELKFENIDNYLKPMYEKMKQGEFSEYEKYVVKDGRATAYVDGRKRYEDKDITSIESQNYADEYPPLTKTYAKSPLQIILDEVSKIKETEDDDELEFDDEGRYKVNDFDFSWISTLSSAGRTLWGTEIPQKDLCKVELGTDDSGTTIKYSLDKESIGYQNYMQKKDKQAKTSDLSWNAVSYFDSAFINVEIDTSGNLRKLEFNTTMAYMNEGIEGFKVPQYIVIEYEYK